MKKLAVRVLYTLIITLTNSQAFSQLSYVVLGNSVNLREAPSLKSKILGTIPGGEVVSVIKDDNSEWYFISYYGNEGYIASKLLIRLENSEQYSDWVKQNAITGDKPDCENITPAYDNDLDNKLLIHVGKSSDAVVKLMNSSGMCIRIAYIRAGESYAMRNIPEDVYYLKIAYGKDFRKYTHHGMCKVKFMVDPIYKLGSEVLDFNRVKRANTIVDGYEYENWQLPSYELSLNTEFAKGSNTFKSNKITVDEFNR